MARIEILLRGATRASDLDTFLDILHNLGAEYDHPIAVRVSGAFGYLAASIGLGYVTVPDRNAKEES